MLNEQSGIRHQTACIFDSWIFLILSQCFLCLQIVPPTHRYPVSVDPIAKNINVGIFISWIKIDQLPVRLEFKTFALAVFHDLRHCLCHLPGIGSKEVHIIDIEHLMPESSDPLATSYNCKVVLSPTSRGINRSSRSASPPRTGRPRS